MSCPGREALCSDTRTLAVCRLLDPRLCDEKRKPRPKGTKGGVSGTLIDGWEATLWVRAPLRQHNGAPEVPSRHVRHEQPIGHSLLEVFEHAGLSSWHADRQRLAVSGPEFDDIGAVRLRAVDS
jgi:hypothetical protein